MIIVLNAYPGTGKLTVGRALIKLISGKMLDIHTVYNLAFALTEFKSPEFIHTTEQVEAIGHDLIRAMPADVPVVLTTVLNEDHIHSDHWGAAEWQRLCALGKDRPPFCVVTLWCDLEENKRRIQSEDRGAMHKPRDPAYAEKNHSKAVPMATQGADFVFNLDTTALSADEAALQIKTWLDGLG